MKLSKLIEKYDYPSPRYTSYPTVPFWQEKSLSAARWQEEVRRRFQEVGAEGLSLYLHLPFCEDLCTYCGCNKRITKNHAVEQPYIEALLQEWQHYQALFGQKALLRELHLGGGTPTFFAPENLEKLLSTILTQVEIAPDASMSVEVHPNTTQAAHLERLYALGFRRLSVGIQDFDPKVQQAINRPQSIAQTARIFEIARNLGYDSINADLIYGLPYQQEASIRHTVGEVLRLRPERIAFYSYAHVPWKSKAQRRYTEADLPSATQKRALYELGRALLLEAGYVEIGFDHFALPDEALAQAARQGQLHRNFMGYTPQASALLIGLGASSISDVGTAFMQNEKEVEAYQAALQAGHLPFMKGHLLSQNDLLLRKHIMEVMCRQETAWQVPHPLLEEAQERLETLAADGLVELLPQGLRVKPQGRMFLRNIALCFDEHYWQQQPQQQMFSKSV